MCHRISTKLLYVLRTHALFECLLIKENIILSAVGETGIVSVSVCIACGESHTVEMSVECFCRDILGEYVSWVVVCVYLD